MQNDNSTFTNKERFFNVIHDHVAKPFFYGVLSVKRKMQIRSPDPIKFQLFPLAFLTMILGIML